MILTQIVDSNQFELTTTNGSHRNKKWYLLREFRYARVEEAIRELPPIYEPSIEAILPETMADS